MGGEAFVRNASEPFGSGAGGGDNWVIMWKEKVTIGKKQMVS